MPAKNQIFACAKCGAQFKKWSGRCLECGDWGSLREEIIEEMEKTKSRQAANATAPKINLKTAKENFQNESIKRHTTGIKELDRVLGGGLVPGSFILLSGEPGIGKSTLALALAASIPQSIYLSGEESEAQIAMRAKRIGRGAETLKIGHSNSLMSAITTIKAEKPLLALIDSVQTFFLGGLESEPGSPNQVKAVASLLLETAKETGTSIVLIGHITKDGQVAGPKTLEHLVDAVLTLEGDRHHLFRILRAAKNRFGSTDEIGLFEMSETGLSSIENPSMALLKERGEPTPGSVLTCLMEGTRGVLVEVQALVSQTSFGYPIRKSNGFDINRLHMLVAVIERHAGLRLQDQDIHINIVGGLSADEPAADLAVCLAIISAIKQKTLPHDIAAWGEVGLSGEIRSARNTEKRLNEAEAHGLKKIYTAKSYKPPKKIPNLRVITIKNIRELFDDRD